MDSALLVAAESIKSSNERRAASSKEFAGALYFFIAIAMIFHALCTAVLTSWVVKFPLVRRVSSLKDVKYARLSTALHFIVLVGAYFLVTGVGGVVAMAVITGLYCVASLVIMVLIVMQRLGSFTASTNPPQCERQDGGEVVVAAAPPNPLVGTSLHHETDVVANQSTSVVDAKQRFRTPTTFPMAFSVTQFTWYLLSLIAVFLSLMVLVIMGFAFGPKEYHVARHATSELEFQPKITATALVAMYAYPGVATKMRMQWPVERFSEQCGVTFTKVLKGATDRHSNILVEWIEKYDINMSEFPRSNYVQYTTVNDFFTREIRLDLRPLPTPVTSLVVSPADCRLLAYATVDDSAVWLKGGVRTAEAITGGAVGRYFDNGSMVIARLAPQDYHRFHSPVSGIVKMIHHVRGTLWSVSADAARSENDAFLNKRIVTIISTPRGDVAFVAIGATCVGSVSMQDENRREWRVNDTVSVGDQLGIMSFGGSTVVLFFPEGMVTLDPVIVQRSQLPVESRLLVNERIGMFNLPV